MSDKRSYGDPCGVSRALDMVGDRWALLIVRELLFGPKRFTDLRRGLPGASPNVLSQRLDEMEEHGVVSRRTLPPPAASRVYELTPWGRDLEPVVLALGSWGSRSPWAVDGPLGVDSMMLALRTVFDPDAADGVDERIAIHLDGDHFRVRVADGAIAVERGEDEDAAARVVTDVGTLRRICFAGLALPDAVRDGSARVDGDAETAARVLALFRRPAPAA